MRIPPSPFLRLLCLLACGWTAAAAQSEQEPQPPATPAAAERVLAVRAGTIHPVAGPELRDGVIVIRGERIAAIGPAAETPIPDGAEVLDLGAAHVYPGLVDALTDAFTDNALRTDNALDAATAVADGLRQRGDREDELVRAGVTTAFVGSGAPAAWRGQGAVIRPTREGFRLLAGHERAAALARLSGPGPSHPLQRLQQAQALFAVFDGLEAYQKAAADHKEALKKYEQDFAAWLAFHEQKKGAGAPAAAQPATGRTEGRPADAAGDAAGGGRTGRPRRRGEQGNGGPPAGERRQEPPNPAPASGQEPAPTATAKPADAPAEPPKDKPPERPAYPKTPASDPVKQTLLDVREGKLPLRIEAARADEIRSALRLAADKGVRITALERPLGAAALAEQLSAAGVACILTDVWPAPLPEAFGKTDRAALPAQLHAHGVAFAIASGAGRAAATLPLQAACAVGAGLDQSTALRAITLTPAEILGVQRDVGSLQTGKLADLLVCDRPLFASDCRVLQVLSAGVTQYQAR